MSEFDLLHWPAIANAVLIKALGKKAVFTVKALEEYKVKSGKNIGEVLPVLLLEHDTGKQTRLSLKTAEHMIRLNAAGFTGSTKLLGCRLVLHTEKVKAFGEMVDAVRIDAILGVDSIQIDVEEPKDELDEPPTTEEGWEGLYGDMEE